MVTALVAAQIPLAMAFGFGPALMAFGGLVAYLGLLAGRGRLPRNHVAGIRIPATMSSPGAWEAGHRSASPWLMAAGASVMIPGAIALLRPSHGLMVALTMSGLALMVALVGVATALASAAAREAES